MGFLQMPQHLLDEGFGIPLQTLAFRSGDQEVHRLQYLMSASVQQALSHAFQASAASSLPVERAFAETKRSEAPRLCHVATAGRNQILRQFLRQRQEILQQAEVASAALRRSMATNIQSLAWELCPKLSDLCLSQQGSAAMREYVASHHNLLQQEVERRRRLARAAVDRTTEAEFPVTYQAWIQWFRRIQDSLYEAMHSASSDRRCQNRRLQAAADTPPAVQRLGSKSARTSSSVVVPWAQVLAGRTGWFLVKAGNRQARMVFLLCFNRRTYALDMSPWRQQQQYLFASGDTLHLDDHIVALDSLDFGPVADVYDIGLGARAFSGSAASAPGSDSVGGVRLNLVSARPLSAALPVRRSAAKRKRAAASVGEEQESSGQESEVHDEVASVSSASSCASVDTDADSGLDESPPDDRKVAPPDDKVDLEAEVDFDVPEAVPEPDAVDPEEQRRQRHPPGTWKIWDGTWFYATKTPGWIDVKCWLKWQFRTSGEGLGTTAMSRTLTPYHYGDDWNDPWKTLLLLRAWSIWRARWQGWAREKDYRLREVTRQVQRFVTDLRSAHSDHHLPLQRPLLASDPAHNLLQKWTPDVVALLVQ